MRCLADRWAPSVFVALTVASGRDQRDGVCRDAVVGSDLRPVLLEGVPSRHGGPDRERAEPEVRQQGEHDDPGADQVLQVRPSPGQAPGAEDACDDERRDQPRGVVEVQRGLVRVLRQDVQRGLGERGEQQPRREQEQESERHEHVREVVDVAARERVLEHGQRMREQRLQNSSRRAADLAVARIERGRVAGEVRHDHLHGEHGGGNAAGHDAGACPALPARDEVPDAEACDHEADLLLARDRGQGEEGEG